MKKIFFLLLITLLFYSCLIRDNPKITIINNSKEEIDSIEVFASSLDRTTFRHIKPNEKRKGIISFKNVPNQDGAYGIFIYNKGINTIQQPFGYYTNGGSIDYEFKVFIENDTIIVKH